MLARTRRVLASSDSGASTVEYGLLVAGIAAVIIAIVFLLGGTLNEMVDGVDECVESEGVACEQGGAGDEGT